MDQSQHIASVRTELAADIRNMPDSRDELVRILNCEALDGSNPFTCVLDLLAGIAEERSRLEGDRHEKIAEAIQDCATRVEHRTGKGAV